MHTHDVPGSLRSSCYARDRDRARVRGQDRRGRCNSVERREDRFLEFFILAHSLDDELCVRQRLEIGSALNSVQSRVCFFLRESLSSDEAFQGTADVGEPAGERFWVGVDERDVESLCGGDLLRFQQSFSLHFVRGFEGREKGTRGLF